MTINRQIKEGAVGARKRATTVRGRTYQYEPCNANYPCMGATPYALPTGADGTFGRVLFPGGDVLYRFNGINTAFGPTISTVNGRLQVDLEQTNNIGVEYFFDSGFVAAGFESRHKTIVGTTDSPFARLSMEITDVSGTDQLLFGYRKNETFQADFNNYDEMAAFNIISGDIFVDTILNGGATASVDTGLNWADTETHELKLIIGEAGFSAGYVRFFVDGEQVGVNPFTFDDGEEIFPFMFFLQDVDLTSGLFWDFFEIGRVKDVEKAI